jgi:hypothetical protein
MTYEQAANALADLWRKAKCDDDELMDSVRKLWFGDVEDLEAENATLSARVAALETLRDAVGNAGSFSSSNTPGIVALAEGDWRKILIAYLATCPPLETEGAA